MAIAVGIIIETSDEVLVNTAIAVIVDLVACFGGAWIDGCIVGITNGWYDGCRDGCIDGCIDG